MVRGLLDWVPVIDRWSCRDVPGIGEKEGNTSEEMMWSVCVYQFGCDKRYALTPLR